MNTLVNICAICNPGIIRQGESASLQVRLEDEAGIPIGNLTDCGVEVTIQSARTVALLFELGGTDEYIKIAVDEKGYVAFVLPGEVTSKMQPGEYFVKIILRSEEIEVTSKLQKIFVLVESVMTEMRTGYAFETIDTNNECLAPSQIPTHDIEMSAALGRLIYGKPGMSAYQSAVNGGYTGVEEHFYAQLAEFQLVVADRGLWNPLSVYNHNEDVYHNNCRWRCLVDGTTSEPSAEAPEWVLLQEAVDGEDALLVTIYSNNGNTFKNGEIAASLTAVVTRGGEDISDAIAPNFYSWERISKNPDTDQIFNQTHRGHGRVLTITPDDVFVRATFDCKVTI